MFFFFTFNRIEIPGEKILILSQLYDKTPGFKYYGAGLDKGQCGVTISKVKGTNHGQVKCYLGSEGTEQQGDINLTVACKREHSQRVCLKFAIYKFFLCRSDTFATRVYSSNLLKIRHLRSW